jgi:hypothetical protein
MSRGRKIPWPAEEFRARYRVAKKKGMSDRQIAAELGVAPQTLSLYKRQYGITNEVIDPARAQGTLVNSVMTGEALAAYIVAIHREAKAAPRKRFRVQIRVMEEGA